MDLKYNPWRRHLPDGLVPPRPMRANPKRDGPAARVTEEYVRCIRASYDAGMSVPELSKRFGRLRAAAIRCIAKRQSWRHVV